MPGGGISLVDNLICVLFQDAAYCGCSSVVEHHVANVAVEGSTPFIRSFFMA